MAIETYFTEENKTLDGIGARHLINKILDRDGNCLNSCQGDVDPDPDNEGYLIKIVRRNLVLKSLRHNEILRKLGIKNLIIKSDPGYHFTIIDEMNTDELYVRIKSFFINLISLTPQDKYILFEGTSILRIIGWEEILGLIDKSVNYINTLPIQPSDIDKKELSQLICCDGLLLFYGGKLKDDYSVQMGSYASELGEQLFGTPKFCKLPLI